MGEPNWLFGPKFPKLAITVVFRQVGPKMGVATPSPHFKCSLLNIKFYQNWIKIVEFSQLRAFGRSVGWLVLQKKFSVQSSVSLFVHSSPPLRALEAGRQARQPKNSKKQGKGTADWFPNGSFPKQKIKIKHHTRFQLYLKAFKSCPIAKIGLTLHRIVLVGGWQGWWVWF